MKRVMYLISLLLILLTPFASASINISLLDVNNTIYNVNTATPESTIQSTIITADTTAGNSVVFAAGAYTGWSSIMQLKCANGTHYTGPANSAGVTFNSAHQAIQQTSASPAIINSDGALSGDTIFEIQGGNSANTTPGSGCTVENFTCEYEECLLTGGTSSTNNPSYGILVQNNTCKLLTSEAGVGGTCFFFHNTSNLRMQYNWIGPNCADTINLFVQGNCGAISMGQDNVNVVADSNYLQFGEEGFASGGSYTSGCTNCSSTNNVIDGFHRIGWEFTNGNSPGNVTGMNITGNIYVNPYNIWSYTGAVSMACCYSGAGSAGYSYHEDDNVFIMNPTSAPANSFYVEELTGGSNSTALRNLDQGKWAISGPGVAAGDIQAPLDISNHIIQGSFGNGYYGCEYGGVINPCKNASGTGNVANVTAIGMSTSTATIQQPTPTPTILPAAGAYSSPPSITLTANGPNETIFYTTDGTPATTSSPIYTGSFTCTSLPCTVKTLAKWGTGAARNFAFPALTGYSASAPATSTFTAGGPVAVNGNDPPYGWLLEKGAIRTLAVYPANSSTNLVNWTASGATLSCATNCPAIVEATVTAPGGTCSVTGSVGSYVVHSTSTATVTATSVDDVTKSHTINLNVCDTSVDAYVDVEPSYNQAFKGQQKTLQSYVVGYTNENVTWSILSQPSGGDGAFVDTIYRDTLFSATVTGRYTLKATSVANSAISGTAIIYVSPNNMPPWPVTPNKTEPTECYVDPALTGTDYEVGPARAYTTLKSLSTYNWTGTGSIVRIHNDGTVGNPTHYHEVMQIQGTGTATQPIYFCGVALAANGELPVIDGDHATEDPNDSPYLTGAGAFKVTYTNSNYGAGYNTGYNFAPTGGSTGPDYFNIVGLSIQNLNNNYGYYPNGSTTLTAYSGGSGIYLRSGQHVHMEGLDIRNTGWGVIDNNNTAYTGSSITRYHQFMGGHISNFSDVNSYSEHALYMEPYSSLIEGNIMEGPGPSDNGDWIKQRGGNSIIRYNLFIGLANFHVVEYPDMEDTWQFTNVSEALGVPGDTVCGDSIWCSISTANITLTQLTENAEWLAKDFNYGNIYANTSTIAGETIQYGSFSAPEECPPCTNMSDRQGRLYFFNNTVDKPLAGVIETTNPYLGSYYAPTPQYGFTTVLLANNLFWNAPGNPLNLNLETTAFYRMQTNMFTTGTMNITTPILGGTGGWGNFTGPYAYPGSVPIDKHMFGLSSGNFLSTSTQPFVTGTYAPIPSSPLIAAGSTITDPAIDHMPLRYQIDTVNGYVKPRANPTTIGAIASSVAATLSGVFIAPSGTSTIVIGGTINLTCTGQYSDGSTQNKTTVATWARTGSHTSIALSAPFEVVTGTSIGTGDTITCTTGGFTSTAVTVNVTGVPSRLQAPRVQSGRMQ